MNLLATLFRPGEPLIFATFIVALGLVMDVADCDTELCYLLGWITLCVMLLLHYSYSVVNESCDNA